MTTKECPICRGVEHTVAVPCVHSNGTSAGELAEQLTGAVDAVQAAIRAVDAAAPNGRDYYLVPGTFERAQAEHQARHNKLLSVLVELAQQYDHVQEVISLNEERRRARMAG